LSQLDLWEDHISRVRRIVEGALRILAAEPPVGDEHNHNRALHKLIVRENLRIRAAGGRGFDWLPHFDGLPAQTGSGPSPEPFERKRPDFNWSYVDDEADVDRSIREFVIECKLLGRLSQSGRNLLTEYVDRGIVRFVSVGHRYGQYASAGMMVGYVKDCEPDDLAEELNGVAELRGLPRLSSVGGNDDDAQLCELEHQLHRPFPDSPYQLNHLWVDLRISEAGPQEVGSPSDDDPSSAETDSPSN
jgi:hypothetical protein